MNLKKYLQKQAEKDAEILLNEDDELFIKQLVQNDTSEIVVQPIKRSKKLWAGLASFATVLVAAVMIFPVVFSNRGTNEIFYQEENVKETSCHFEEMQANIKYFQIEENVNSDYRYTLNYDSVSNDKLYYKIEGSTELSEFKLYLVVNDHYDYQIELSENLLSQSLSDYVINYFKTGMSDIDKSEVGYSGYIKLQTEIIYIEYQQFIDIGEQAFFDDIQSIIKVKN